MFHGVRRLRRRKFAGMANLGDGAGRNSKNYCQEAYRLVRSGLGGVDEFAAM